ncbi:MAG: trehalose-6-phosphate synthase [Planctomycetota bacterium]
MGRSDILVVANRLPVRRMRQGGKARWETSPGGLVSALMPVLKERGNGCWIGWTGQRSGSFRPFRHAGIRNVPVSLTREEVGDYYDGMANSSLWPLYHDVVRPPVYRRYWWYAYESINSRFAEIAAREAAEGAFVWIHDYHLHLVPGFLRQLRPDLRIGFFLHIPFPGRGLFAQLPWRTQILKGTLGADVVGFQTKAGARNFRDLARRFCGATLAPGGLELEGRRIQVDAFPISIDARRFDELARREETILRAEEFRRRLLGRKVMLGVDRLDYTKGIDIRLRAFHELLRSRLAGIDDVVFIQSVVASREQVEAYGELRSEVEELVGTINGEFGEVGKVAVQYLRQNLGPVELVAMYRAADVMVVTPYRDGMNLVAKEYVASHPEEDGVLVLSEFTGAATELEQALVVNPHDLEGLTASMARALRMEVPERKKRMRALRKTVFTHDVHAWAAGFMSRLAG